jgi:hypothetical protein
MQIRKKGDEIKKKSSPLKLLSQSQPNFAAVLYPRWPPLHKIEQFWSFEEFSIFSNEGHIGCRTALTDTFLKGDHPRIISAKFARKCPNLNCISIMMSFLTYIT